MTTLALDIGGTKLMAALVEGREMIEMRRIPTDRTAGPVAWLDAAAELCRDWRGRYDSIGIAVTGRVDAAGLWSALNPETLNIPANTPIIEMAATRFAAPAFAVNDAQAAAWAEYRFGAGKGLDLVFLTISTGIGGGIIQNGRLLSGRSGLAGHFGQIHAGSETRLESRAAGRWLAAAADELDQSGDAMSVFAAVQDGESWAVALRNTTLTEVAGLVTDIQLMLDPQVVVIGGGIGLSDDFIPDLRDRIADVEPVLRPEIRPAALGAEAGVLGAADLARINLPT